MRTYIEIKTDFEATHNWPECPIDEVGFLRNEHRHKIYVTAKIETTGDRQIEFFMFKGFIDDKINNNFGTSRVKKLGRKSMEELSTTLLNKIQDTYGTDRYVSVCCSEDNQVAGMVEYSP